MVSVRIVTDPAEARRLWEGLFPREALPDGWEVRDCFQRAFRRPLHFVVAEERGEVVGFLPLSRIEERDGYGYFPGETWQGRTWLEQNRIHARDEGVLSELLAACAGRYEIRYLLPGNLPASRLTIDEINYRFVPGQHEYSMENYFRQFSHRSAKRLRRDVAALGARLRLRLDDPGDFDALVRLNEGRFGERSYFADPRFREGFRNLMELARERGWLRMTAFFDGDLPVAVDFGCLYERAYTLLGGGTHGDYPGVAKLINLHHMERACRERFDGVDFLCGDFSWKSLFHLTPRPFYLLAGDGAGPARATDAASAASASRAEADPPQLSSAARDGEHGTRPARVESKVHGG
ncbi:MAG: GNAT family N-acetyltransferase [Candidatus Eisenbacteria bacterium]